jgi:hypothetical protein
MFPFDTKSSRITRCATEGWPVPVELLATPLLLLLLLLDPDDDDDDMVVEEMEL